MADLDSVDLDADEWSGDINNVASVLKLWLRELPDPLLTYELHNGFLEAASTRISPIKLPSSQFPPFSLLGNENDRLRHIRLHERVNDLPDPNYATLKYLMGHLNRSATHAVFFSLFFFVHVFICVVVGSRSTKKRTTCLYQTWPSCLDRRCSVSNVVFRSTLSYRTRRVISNLHPTHWLRADGYLTWQAVETILRHYSDIFIDESETT